MRWFPTKEGPNASKDVALAKASPGSRRFRIEDLRGSKKARRRDRRGVAKQKTVSQLTLNGIAAQAAMNAKDCSGAVATTRRLWL